MSVWNTSAADRVASLREQAAAAGEPAAQLSDLELLNGAYESVLREQIDTRDRYMGLLTSLRKHDEALRTAAISTFKEDADRYAQHAVARHMKPFDALLHQAANLPDRPGPQQMNRLRSAADRVRSELKDAGPASALIDPGGTRHTLRTLRHVVGVLGSREGLDGADVLRLVNNVLDDEAPFDLFDVADRSTPRPVPPTPEPTFAGQGWTEARGLWTYQPEDTRAHVKAYPLGEDWYVDLWSARGQLLAFGIVPETEVAALAPGLTALADTWTRDRSEYAWRRFADTAQALRTAPPPPHRTSASPGTAPTTHPEGARVHAATAASPGRPATATGSEAAPLPTPPATARGLNNAPYPGPGQRTGSGRSL